LQEALDLSFDRLLLMMTSNTAKGNTSYPNLIREHDLFWNNNYFNVIHCQKKFMEEMLQISPSLFLAVIYR